MFNKFNVFYKYSFKNGSTWNKYYTKIGNAIKFHYLIMRESRTV